MNKICKSYWNHFLRDKKEENSVTAWKFGSDSDKLADLVARGIKTATCSAYVFYELEHEKLPQKGEYNIILNSHDEPVCITRTNEVAIIPMDEVSEEHAQAEGEGDCTYQYWWTVHQEFFTRELASLGQSFRKDMPLVCERFTLVDVRTQKSTSPSREVNDL
ncbi:ASCH domain-containing protein [Sporolactobacillus sp. STSJ-5]|uniref:ASCH domain-containing protein n=1 Tax=Sporolactobacillus sp. STSJ-5 TaxID=2965076 RepID=UPI0021047620|nr:ASCH domain-containing protein [Sporolactobacillus sp. STSJ-5]